MFAACSTLPPEALVDLTFVLPEPVGALIQVRGKACRLGAEEVWVHFLAPSESSCQRLPEFIAVQRSS